jgi:hypothetical protein
MKLSHLFKDEREEGSAIVEFILLAVPLFLTIIIFVSQFGSLSAGEIRARSLAREMVRAFVASESESSAREKSAIVMRFGAERLGFSSNEISTFDAEFICSHHPCFTEGGRVRVSITFRPDGVERDIRVSAEEYISPWQ